MQLIDPPRLVNWELTYERPRYLGGETVKLQAGRGPYALPAGSRLRIQGQATSALQEVRWRYAQQLTTLPLTTTDRRMFGGVVEPEQLGSGMHTLELLDEHGFAPAEPIQVELQVVPDRPPDVTAEWRGATRLVTRQAELEAHITAHDDWGLQAIRAELGRSGAAGATPTTGAVMERTTVALLEVEAAPRQHEVTTKLDLEPLKLSVGQVLSLQAVATDHQPGEAGTGRSSEFVLRVVDEDELQTDLLNREKQQRQQLEQVVADELSFADELLQLQENPNEAALAALRGRSQQLNVSLLAAAVQLQQLIVEARHNRLPAIATAMSQRLGQRVIPELRQVAQQAADEVQVELQAAWRESSDQVAPVRQHLQRATAAQQQLSQRLQRAVSELNRVESYQEAVSQLHQLRRRQSELLEETSLVRIDAARLALDGDATANRPPGTALPDKAPPAPSPPGTAASSLRERIMQLAQGQRRLVRTWEEYQTRLPPLAQSLSESEPERSERITRVIGQARERMLSQLVGNVPDQLTAQQWDEAERGQRQVVRELRELLDILLNRESREGDGAGLAEKLRGEFLELLNVQRAITTETRATALRRGEDGQWKRAERLIFARLSQQESQLAQRAAAIETLVGEAPGAVALLAIVSELRELLQQVASDLSALRVDAELTGRQRVIEELLAELAGVLREEARAAESEGEEPPMVPSEQSVAGAAPVVRPSAEWKLLRAAQLRLLRETQRLDEQQSRGPLDAAQERQLEQVIRRQEELQRRVENDGRRATDF
ncbi:MAG: hypothetical protein ACKOU6_11205 [Planctomycetota bacterium]